MRTPGRFFVFVYFSFILAAGCSAVSAPDQIAAERPQISAASPVPEIIVTESAAGTAPPKLLVFRQTDDGDVAPLRSVDGSGAGALSFSGVAIGPSGNLYVTDPTDEQVIVYAKSASGPAAPLFTITCAGFAAPTSVGFDRRARMYVTNSGGAPFSISILPATASGCVSGNPTISGGRTELFNPQGIDAAPAGRLFVLDNNDSVTEYAPGASGNAGWTHKIHGPDTKLRTNSGCGDAIFVAGDFIYVANEAGRSVTEYAVSSNGDAAPIRTIAGPQTGLHAPTAITVNDAGEIFVANSFGGSITVYGPGAHGDAAPERTIAGPDTQLVSPVGIARDD